MFLEILPTMFLPRVPDTYPKNPFFATYPRRTPNGSSTPRSLCLDPPIVNLAKQPCWSLGATQVLAFVARGSVASTRTIVPYQRSRVARPASVAGSSWLSDVCTDAARGFLDC